MVLQYQLLLRILDQDLDKKHPRTSWYQGKLVMALIQDLLKICKSNPLIRWKRSGSHIRKHHSQIIKSTESITPLPRQVLAIHLYRTPCLQLESNPRKTPSLLLSTRSADNKFKSSKIRIIKQFKGPIGFQMQSPRTTLG